MTGVVVAAGGAAWERQVLEAVEAAPDLRLARRCLDAADLLAVARTGAADRALVAVDLPGLDLGVVDDVASAGVDVIAVGDEGVRPRAEAIGIHALVAPDAVGHLAPALEPRPTPVAGGAIWAVMGTAGAPGVTTVAVSLADAAAQRGIDTALVDVDLRAGSIGQQLGVLEDVSGLLAACRAVTRGRADEVREQFIEVHPQLRVLTGFPRPDAVAHIRPVALGRVVELVADEAGLTVVDCGELPESTGPLERVLAAATRVIVVGRADPVGLSRLVRLLHEFGDSADLVLIVNQMRPGLGWSEGDVATTIGALAGHEPDAFLPWDQAGLDRAVMRGELPRDAAPKSLFVARVDAVAERLLARQS
jgi:MinD-like ATPase involved in chromosome partitioning or flagellar assembly